MRFNPPPGWPIEPSWAPPQGWTPDPAWPPAPAGWQFWIADGVPPGRRRMSKGAVIALATGVVALVAAIAVVVTLGLRDSDADNAKSSAGNSTSSAKSDRPNAIRVASPRLVTGADSAQPKVLLSVYEDFLCPVCGSFEQKFGPTIDTLIDTGAVAVDYYMVTILDRVATYSSRSAAAAYCVADDSADAFRRFHALLFARQPSETAASFPDDAALTEDARVAGSGDAGACITSGRYIPMVKGLADAENINAVPTVRINGEPFQPMTSTPEDLITRVKSIEGDLPSGVTPTTR